VVLGFPLRQVLPVAVGMLVATAGLMTGLALLVVAGPVVGVVASFGRWRGAPLYEFLAPGCRLAWHRGRSTWTARSMLAAGPGFERDLPAELRGVELVETSWPWTPAPVGVVRDRASATVSATITAAATGFPMRSLGEQDAMLAMWGGALAPFARPHSPVSRVTWQEWSHAKGVDSHRQRVAELHAVRHGPHPDPKSLAEYDALLELQSPVTVSHEATITLTVDVRRVARRRRLGPIDAAIAALGEELELFVERLSTAALAPSPPLSPVELACLTRMRSDPARARRLRGLRQSLASATGRAGIEWGPMAVESTWSTCRVDDALHRTFRMTELPLLPVPANWLDGLLTDTATTRTVTVVYEPIPLNKAAAAVNRELTSIESSHEDKARRGFRVTARERRRLADVEARERDLARGHPEFRHAGLVTVTAADGDLAHLDEACAQVENAAGKSLIELRPLVARQGEGWVASLPLGRSFRPGR
jgi:hypothetical protein